MKERIRVKATTRVIGRGVPDDAKPGDLVIGNRGGAAEVRFSHQYGSRFDPRKVVDHVHDLQTALDAYWSARNQREEQAAYHEILLFGGKDGWHNSGRIRMPLARALRRLALWIERR